MLVLIKMREVKTAFRIVTVMEARNESIARSIAQRTKGDAWVVDVCQPASEQDIATWTLANTRT